jgi:uncharacterized protein (UPF0548 family)
MRSLSKPTDEAVQKFIAAQRSQEFTYAPVGATAGTPPEGFALDHVRVKLGEGASAFKAARGALERWEQFHLGWMEALPARTSIVAGQTVAVAVRAAGMWWLNASRIVYVIDEDGPITRFGFAYGTLPGHAESGEERFLVEWDRAPDDVWYSILAFSRPHHWLARAGYPLVRRLQRRFGTESAAAMVRAVDKARST